MYAEVRHKSTVADIEFGMATKRPRNAAQTRADILAAARRRFATEGYEGTTLRAVAADVGVDAALVIRYFGSKKDLFATAVEFTIELPDLSGSTRRLRGHAVAAVLRGMGREPYVLSAVAGGHDEQDRSGDVVSGAR